MISFQFHIEAHQKNKPNPYRIGFKIFLKIYCLKFIVNGPLLME